jgi:triosephosphate isomerase (TIM)
MRRKLVAGNWKMNGSLAGNVELLGALNDALQPFPDVDVAVFPPAVYLAQVSEILANTGISVGAQDVCEQADSGAFTGQVSGRMLAELGCRQVIIGHSERRAMYGDTNERVAEKVLQALAVGLVPVLCVGETESERDAGQTLEVIAAQLKAVVSELDDEQLAQLVVAYEPVWAIGTGKTASPVQAQEVHKFIRANIAVRGETLAESLRILYGGSVKAANAQELFAQPDIDGGLIGGASLDAQEFSAICRAAE